MRGDVVRCIDVLRRAGGVGGAVRDPDDAEAAGEVAAVRLGDAGVVDGEGGEPGCAAAVGAGHVECQVLAADRGDLGLGQHLHVDARRRDSRVGLAHRHRQRARPGVAGLRNRDGDISRGGPRHRWVHPGRIGVVTRRVVRGSADSRLERRCDRRRGLDRVGRWRRAVRERGRTGMKQ